MTEASGKGNCMFASTKINKKLSLPILIGGFLCASHLLAQEQVEQSSQGVETQDSSDGRHIDRLGEGDTEEWDMDLALPQAPVVKTTSESFALPDADQNRQLKQLLAKMGSDPGNSQTLAKLNTLLRDILRQANDMMVPGSYDQASQMLDLVQSMNPEFVGLETSRQRFTELKDADNLLVAGHAAMAAQRYTGDNKLNALYFYRQTLSKDPQNESAKQGLGSIQQVLIQTAMDSARDMDFDLAEEWLHEASTIQENQAPVEKALDELVIYKSDRAVELEEAAIEAMNAGEFTLADFNIIDLIALGGHESRVQSLRVRLEEARVYGGFEPGQIIRDEFRDSEGEAPATVVIAAGSFLMGSEGRSGGSYDNELPRHRVTIEQGFGIGVTEVTVAEFRTFIEDTGYRTAAEQNGSSSIYSESAGRISRRSGVSWEHSYHGKKSKPNVPVLHVNFYDAMAYVDWLAKKTGKRYRLPSEAEYEFVARAGGIGSYWWGEGSPAEPVENLTGSRDSSPGKRQWSTSFEKYGDGNWGPAPVGSIGEGVLVHPMGVQDITGNVSEWMADCWHQNYVKGPTDGSAWINPGCKRRVARGGYWASAPAQSRAAFRISANPETFGPVVGFRIARDL
jgi:formylglycine-generating enzyme required for sulfatase activity